MTILKRIGSLLLAAVMVLSMLPVQALAVQTTEEAPAVTEAAAETQAPDTEVPEAEAPEAETPPVEAPATEVPETEAPATEAPKAETAETEAPETLEAMQETSESAPAAEACQHTIYEWLSDAAGHYGTCSECGEDVYEEHRWEAVDGVDTCAVCGYKDHAHQMRWSFDKVGHAGFCTECSYRPEWVEHTMQVENGVTTCKECGYKEHTHAFTSWESFPEGHNHSCQDCGFAESLDHQWQSNADGVNVCTDCGRKDHTHSTSNWWYKDEGFHYGNCDDCNGNIRELHTMQTVDGIDSCTVCGYPEEMTTAYAITYILNGGTNSPENPDSYVEGAGCTLSDPTRRGYTFDGWYTEETFTNPVTEISAEQTGNVTLYARWRSLHKLDPESAQISEGYHSGWCLHCEQWLNSVHDWDYGVSLGKYCPVCGYRDHEHTIIGYQKDQNYHTPICEVCGPYNMTAHTGMEDDVCDVCGYMDHVHHSDSLVSNGYRHEGVCAECGYDMTDSHTWSEGGSACTVCGYSHAHEMQWSFSESGHNNYCTNCSYGSHWTEHTMEDRNGVPTCKGCGYMEHDHLCGSWEKYDDHHYGICDECGFNMYGSHENIEGSDPKTCKVCGYMEHVHTGSNWKPTYEWSEELQGSYSVSHRGVCTVCGGFTEEAHVFDENFVCTVCGYHDHTKSAPVITGWNGDEEAHGGTCAVCGEYFNELHKWGGENGTVCTVCGYEKHEHVWGTHYFGITESEHRRSCQYQGKSGVHCNESSMEFHRFATVDGIKTCTACGYMEHTHDFGGWESSEWGHNRQCVTCGFGEGTEHQWETNEDGVKICTVCGYMDHEHVVSQWNKTEEAHYGYCDFGPAYIYSPHTMQTIGGVPTCTVCGYKEHKHTPMYGWGNNANFHNNQCKDCGTGYQEAHTWKTVSGVKTCTVCGYKDHKHKAVSWNQTEFWHVSECADCGASIQEPHDYAGGKTCTVCGYTQHLHKWDKQWQVAEESHGKVCTVCGQTRWSQHRMKLVDGVRTCTVCGCKDHDHKVSKWTADQEYGHFGSCTDCGAEIFRDHTPNSKGICTVCGYSNKPAKTSAITYVLNGGTNDPSNPTAYTEGIGCALLEPTKEGYVFAGWFTDQACTKRITEISSEQTGVVTLYAKWIKQADVTYTWSGDVPTEISGLPADQQDCEVGAQVTIDATYPQSLENGVWIPYSVWEGERLYAFYGWYIDSNGNGLVDETDRRAGGKEILPEGGLNLVGLWRICPTIHFQWEEGTPEGIVSDPETYPLPYDWAWRWDTWDETNYPIYEGSYEDGKEPCYTYEDGNSIYTFAGWFDADGNEIILLETLSQETDILNLYGRWAREGKYAVTYTWSGDVPPEGDGYYPTGSCPTIPEDGRRYTVGETVSLQAPYNGFEFGMTLSKYNPEDPNRPTMWYFDGWYIDADQNGQVDETDPYVGPTAVMEAGGLHLVGKWSRYHWVTAAWEEGTPEGVMANAIDYPLPDPREFPCPAGVSASFYLTYSGLTSYTDKDGTVYHFDGIYMGDEKIGAETVMPDHDVELKLRWTAAEEQEIRHTITYVLNGGVNAPDAPTYYVEGQTCKLTEPSRGDDAFMGWYVNTEKYVGEPITEIPADMDITEGITLYAKWEVTSCDVTYELNGSDAAPVYNDPANPATLTPSAKSVKLKKPTRAGYKFDGWFVDGEPVTEIAFDGRSELTVEAYWTAIDYKITYKNVAKDEYNPNPTTFTIEGLTLEPLYRDGFTFGGWWTDAKCQKQEITEIPAGTAKKMTVYAKWDVHTYTVHFDRNAPEGVEITGKDMKDLTVACGKTVKLTGCAFKDPSKQYVFAGWNTIPNGSGEGFVDKQAIENLILENGGEITLYAQWAENDGSYAIIFNANAYGYGGEDPDPMTGYYTKSVKLPKSPYTLPGYTFTGWNTASDGSGATYKAGASVKAICADDSGEVTLYAQWKPITYKISYSLNGGGKVPTNPTTYTMDTLAYGPIYLDAPEKKGYTFRGWSTTSKGTPDPDYCIEEKPTGKTTTLKLYAQWRPNEYTIWLAGNGADNSMEPITVQYGKTVKLNNTLTREGYRFLGWNTMPDGSGKAYKDKASVKNLTLVDGDTVVLYAQWASESYTIRFSANGGSGTMEPMEGVKYGKSQRLTANEFAPSRDGYTFLGWNTKPDGSGKAYKDKASVKNLAPYDSDTATLYAQWVKDEYTVVFDANGGEDENGKRIASQSGLPYKKSTKLDDDPFEREGYTFLGWNTKADGTGKTYKNKASVKSLCATGDGVVTLYAQWKLVTYKISYSLNGGKHTTKDMLKTYSVTTDFTTTSGLPTPTKTVKKVTYEFDGWYVKETETVSGKKTTVERDVVFTEKGIVYAETETPVYPQSGTTLKLYARWK